MNGPRLVAKQAHSRFVDEAAAVADLSTQLQASSASLVLSFCSPRYDLAKLGRALAESFAAPLARCTTAGQFGEHGYVDGGITAVSLSSTELHAKPYGEQFDALHVNQTFTAVALGGA